MVQRLDFERMLGAPTRQRSARFALHHLPEPSAERRLPSRLARRTASHPPLAPNLSTDAAPLCTQLVDDLPLCTQWLGTVVPKRHAKRATTRNLLKRQIHHQFQAHSARLPAGLWLVRLKAPFERRLFPSARSDALALAVRSELAALLRRAGEAG